MDVLECLTRNDLQSLIVV